MKPVYANFCKHASDEVLEHVLDERELESLRFGYRERVTDTHLPHIRELPQVLAGNLCRRRGPRA